MTTIDRQQFSEAMELWREAHCLYPRVDDIYRLLDIEKKRLDLNQRYERFLLSDWLGEPIMTDEINRFVEDTRVWRQNVLTEILSSGPSV